MPEAFDSSPFVEDDFLEALMIAGDEQIKVHAQRIHDTILPCANRMVQGVQEILSFNGGGNGGCPPLPRVEQELLRSREVSDTVVKTMVTLDGLGGAEQIRQERRHLINHYLEPIGNRADHAKSLLTSLKNQLRDAGNNGSSNRMQNNEVAAPAAPGASPAAAAAAASGGVPWPPSTPPAESGLSKIHGDIVGILERLERSRPSADGSPLQAIRPKPPAEAVKSLEGVLSEVQRTDLGRRDAATLALAAHAYDTLIMGAQTCLVAISQHPLRENYEKLKLMCLGQQVVKNSTLALLLAKMVEFLRKLLI